MAKRRGVTFIATVCCEPAGESTLFDETAHPYDCEMIPLESQNHYVYSRL